MRTAVTLRCQPCLKVARESRQVSSPCSVAFLQGARPERLGPDVPAATQTPSRRLRGVSAEKLHETSTHCVLHRTCVSGRGQASRHTVISAIHGGDRAPRGARSFSKPLLT